jgi:hypothetical protein
LLNLEKCLNKECDDGGLSEYVNKEKDNLHIQLDYPFLKLFNFAVDLNILSQNDAFVNSNLY